MLIAGVDDQGTHLYQTCPSGNLYDHVAAAIGATKAAAFDLTAACSGFLFGLVTASQFIQTGTYKKVLVIGGDTLKAVNIYRVVFSDY